MELRELKKYIFDNQKVEEILYSLQCSNVVYHDTGYYTACNINGDNPSAINVYDDEYLHVINHTRTLEGNSRSFDIFNLAIYNLSVINSDKCSLNEASMFIHNQLGLEYKPFKYKKDVKFDPLDVFKKIVTVIDNNENEVPDDIEMYDFCEGTVHRKWLSLGLTKGTIDKFNVGYSYRMKRMIMPLKYWKDGRIIGYNKRTVVDNSNDLGIRKYLITPNYPKRINLYGLWENRESIVSYKRIVLFEAEKSVLIRDSRMDSCCVALSGHTISKEQVAIICGLDINEVVIAMDKDININEVRSLCDKFYNKKIVSYIYDEHDLLNDKDSPADAVNDIYDYLYENRVKYDFNEREKFLSYMKGETD